MSIDKFIAPLVSAYSRTSRPSQNQHAALGSPGPQYANCTESGCGKPVRVLRTVVGLRFRHKAEIKGGKIAMSGVALVTWSFQLPNRNRSAWTQGRVDTAQQIRYLGRAEMMKDVRQQSRVRLFELIMSHVARLIVDQLRES